jgi:hypothetical protein
MGWVRWDPARETPPRNECIRRAAHAGLRYGRQSEAASDGRDPGDVGDATVRAMERGPELTPRRSPRNAAEGSAGQGRRGTVNTEPGTEGMDGSGWVGWNGQRNHRRLPSEVR